MSYISSSSGGSEGEREGEREGGRERGKGERDRCVVVCLWTWEEWREGGRE